MKDLLERISMFTDLSSKLDENSTEDCLNTLKACIAFYEDQENLDDTGKDVLKTLNGILSYYDKEGSFTPGQAKAVFNISKGISKITK